MPEWAVNLIVGIVTAILGFIGGFFTKSKLIKEKKNFNQNIKCNNNTQSVNIEIGVEKRRKNK